jgi:hypothetical protein
MSPKGESTCGFTHATTDIETSAHHRIDLTDAPRAPVLRNRSVWRSERVEENSHVAGRDTRLGCETLDES